MAASAVGERFRQICRERSGAVAVRNVPSGAMTTFDELARESASIERVLREFGIGSGAAVVSCLGNRSIFFSLLVACMDTGAALVPLGEATDAEALALIEQAGAAAVIADRRLPLAASATRAFAPDVYLHVLAGRVPRRAYPASVVLKLTSGSTQLPKAAIASEMHLVNDGRHIIEAMGIGPDDVNFACIPLSHSYALGNIVMPLLWQGSRVALRQSFSPSQFTADVEETGATVFPGVPFMFERLKSLDDLDRLPRCLRLLITAGARIDAATVTWFRNSLDRKVHSFYGSSETGGIAYDDSEEVGDPLHVGRAMPETTLTIVEAPGDASAGRIRVAGNAVAFGYADAAEDDAVSAFDDGGFMTGDVGYLDEAGRLILTGRVSPLVHVSGRKVDPVEVERTLLQLAGIADARVFGMACDTRGQEVIALLVRTDEALTPIAIRQHCAATLSAHKIPRRFVFVDRLPIDARGKIDRRVLIQLASVRSD
jgi:long-chain acyl-CoA synthetase